MCALAVHERPVEDPTTWRSYARAGIRREAAGAASGRSRSLKSAAATRSPRNGREAVSRRAGHPHPPKGGGTGREPADNLRETLHKSCARRRTLELEATFLARSQPPPPTPLGVQTSMEQPVSRARPTVASLK